MAMPTEAREDNQPTIGTRRATGKAQSLGEEAKSQGESRQLQVPVAEAHATSQRRHSASHALTPRRPFAVARGLQTRAGQHKHNRLVSY